MKLAEIGEKICGHLGRFEADSAINVEKMGSHPYYHAFASSSSNRVFVQYVSYQGHTSLSKSEAVIYLNWLNKGNVGTHYQALDEAKKLSE